MTDLTPNLLLPYILAAQAQKHVTHNEAIRALDAIVQLEVADRHLTAPPVSPADGSRYIVAAGANGAWSGQDGAIAAFQDAAWAFYAPREGWRAWIADEAIGCTFTRSAWQLDGGTGSGTAANPWAGKSWAALGTSITSQGLYTGPLATLIGATLTNLGVSGGHVSVPTNPASTGLEIYNAIAGIPAGTSLVTLEAGINDFGRAAPLGTIADTTTASFYGALLAAGIAILAADATRTLVYLTPYNIAFTGYAGGANWHTPNSNGNTLAQYQQAVRDVAAHLGCAVIDVAAASGLSAQTAGLYLGDGLHPNATGGTRMAQFIADRLPLVRPVTASVAQVATPTFSPAAGSYTGTQTVTIASTTSGATIHYTTDGSTPTSASPTYSAPISVAATETVAAIAIAAGYTNSAVGSAAYTIGMAPAATPTFSPAAGSYTAVQTVTIASTTSGAVIHYTTDGTTPTSASPTYSAPISVAATETVAAIAIAAGFANSAVGSAAYTIGMAPAATPTFSPAAGSYTAVQTVTIASTTSGATIHYTTDGTTPTSASPTYSAPISVAASETVAAIAIAAGYANSAVGTAAYTIASSASWMTAYSQAMSMDGPYANLTIVSRIKAAALTLPSGTIQKIRVTLVGDTADLYVGPAAASGNVYDAASLTHLTFGGASASPGAGGTPLSDEIAFAWNKVGDLIISGFDNGAHAHGRNNPGTAVVDAYYVSGADASATAAKASGYAALAGYGYFVSKIEFYA